MTGDVKSDLLVDTSRLLVKEDEEVRGTVAGIIQEAAQHAREGEYLRIHYFTNRYERAD